MTATYRMTKCRTCSEEFTTVSLKTSLECPACRLEANRQVRAERLEHEAQIAKKILKLRQMPVKKLRTAIIEANFTKDELMRWKSR